MINLLKEATDAATSGSGIIALLAIVLGGTGFWKLIEIIFQAKREDKKDKSTTDDKVDKLSKQVTDMTSDFKDIVIDIKDIKSDLALLQEANEATVKYRELRDEQDRVSSIERAAVIKSLKSMMRDRLLETYERCMEKGYYTIEERDIYNKLYSCYKEEPFSGNGTIGELHDRIIQLPTTKEEALEGKKILEPIK